MSEYQQTPFEKKVQILGDRVMVKAVMLRKPSDTIIAPNEKAEEKIRGYCVVCAVGNGPNMPASPLKVGVCVELPRMPDGSAMGCFQLILDPIKKEAYRIYSIQDVLAIVPNPAEPQLEVVE